MDVQTVLGLIARHALTTLAGVLVAHGYLGSSGTEQFIGAGMMLAGVGWSWWQKSGQAQVADLLKKVTGHRTVEGAVAKAQLTPAAPVVSAAQDQATIATAAKVLGLLFATLLVASAARPALAADALPVKAPTLRAPSPCIPTACTGFYLGVNLSGAMTNADVIGSGINGSLAGGGQSIGLQGGYQFASGGWFWGGEVQANYVVRANSILTNGADTRYRVGEYLKVGTALSNIFSLGGISTTQGPGVPSAFTAAVISPYVLFGAVQSGIGQGWATGAGVEFAVTQNWFVDTRYTYVNYGSASVAPGVVAKTENLVTAGLNYKF